MTNLNDDNNIDTYPNGNTNTNIIKKSSVPLTNNYSLTTKFVRTTSSLFDTFKKSSRLGNNKQNPIINDSIKPEMTNTKYKNLHFSNYRSLSNKKTKNVDYLSNLLTDDQVCMLHKCYGLNYDKENEIYKTTK